MRHTHVGLIIHFPTQAHKMSEYSESVIHAQRHRHRLLQRMVNVSVIPGGKNVC